jgi:hypothetical protein
MARLEWRGGQERARWDYNQVLWLTEEWCGGARVNWRTGCDALEWSEDLEAWR